MNTDEWFIESRQLPYPLTKEETSKLFKEIYEGNESLKEVIITHNIRLVLYQVSKRFKTAKYDKKELVSNGIMGLINAVNTFDITKNIEFTTYAAKCIDNEILHFMKMNKKYENMKSIETHVIPNQDDSRTKLKDIIPDKQDIAGEYETKEEYHIIREIVMTLPPKEREIIMLYFGFYNDTPYGEAEIAKNMQMTKANVSRIINKVVHEMRANLVKKYDIYEFNKSNIIDVERKHHCGVKMQTIYELCNNYTKEQIDIIINSLSEYEKKLLKIRYGEDLENPVKSYITAKDKVMFYSSLIPKIRRLLKTTYNK